MSDEFYRPIADYEIEKIKQIAKNYSPKPISDEDIIIFETSIGTFKGIFYNDKAPNHCLNFKKLANSGFYDGTKFHRVIPNFMIQGGCPNTKSGEGVPGSGGPGYTIADECKGDNARMHFADSVAMAKTSAPNTAGSQFYLNHRPTTWLNKRHTVFGRVLEGRDVACKLRKDDVIEGIEIIRLRDGSSYTPKTSLDADESPTEQKGLGGAESLDAEAKEGS